MRIEANHRFKAGTISGHVVRVHLALASNHPELLRTRHHTVALHGQRDQSTLALVIKHLLELQRVRERVEAEQ